MAHILINDTNVLIDLCNSGLIRHCQQLSLEMHTIEYVVEEIIDAEQKAAVSSMIREGALKIDILDGEDNINLFNLFALKRQNSNLSLPDCAVIVCAKRHGYHVIIGDRRMRRFAESQGLQVSGTLYLTDLLVDEGIVSPVLMAEHLRQLAISNVRIPRNAIDERIKRFLQDNKTQI